MPVYVLRTLKVKSVVKWVDDTRRRSESGNLLKNPFKMQFRVYKNADHLLLLCKVNPIYPNFSVFGWLTGFAVLLIWGYHWILWPCLLVGMMGYFWSSPFYAFMTRVALRKKAKYSGPIKRLWMSHFVEEVMFKDGATRMS